MIPWRPSRASLQVVSGLHLHPIITVKSNHLVHSLLHPLLFPHLRTSKCHFSCFFLLIHYHHSFTNLLHEVLTSFFLSSPFPLLSCRWTNKIHCYLLSIFLVLDSPPTLSSHRILLSLVPALPPELTTNCSFRLHSFTGERSG